MERELNVPEKLKKAIQNNSLVFFVGAGCSLSLGYPSWKTLIEGVLDELDTKFGDKSDINFKNILETVKSNNKSLFSVLNKIENDIDHGVLYKKKAKEYVTKCIEDISKTMPPESLVHNLLWQISEKIVTTNYDRALEFISQKIYNLKFLKTIMPIKF